MERQLPRGDFYAKNDENCIIFDLYIFIKETNLVVTLQHSPIENKFKLHSGKRPFNFSVFISYLHGI